MSYYSKIEGRWSQKYCKRKTCSKRISEKGISTIGLTNNVKEILKDVFFVTANEGFLLSNIDVRAVFLQPRGLDHEVFLDPIRDVKTEGMIWLLKNPL